MGQSLSINLREDLPTIKMEIGNSGREVVASGVVAEKIREDLVNLFNEVDSTNKSINIGAERILNFDGLKAEITHTLDQLLSGLKNFPDGSMNDPVITRLRDDVVVQLERVFDGVRYDEFGVPMHKLRSEIVDYVDRAKNGEATIVDFSGLTVDEVKNKKLLPKYCRGHWKILVGDELIDVTGDYVEYLASVFGKYLFKYNGEEDYLFLDELRLMSPKLVKSLDMHIRRNFEGKRLSDYVLASKAKTEKNIEKFTDSPALKAVGKNYISLLSRKKL